MTESSTHKQAFFIPTVQCVFIQRSYRRISKKNTSHRPQRYIAFVILLCSLITCTCTSPTTNGTSPFESIYLSLITCTSHRFDSRKKQNTKKYHLLYYPSYICFNFVHACHCGSSSVAFTQKATILQYSNPASYHIISYHINKQTNKQDHHPPLPTTRSLLYIPTVQ